MEVFAQATKKLKEIYLKSQRISTIESFKKFGLTDCGIIDICKNQYLVLTNDLDLLGYLHHQGIDAVNFADLREWYSSLFE